METYVAVLSHAESPASVAGILLRSNRRITIHASDFAEPDELIANAQKIINGLNGRFCLVEAGDTVTSLAWSAQAATKFIHP
ncbi:hypothetical protein [Streptomyces sp. NPDC048710]|uniref:hypothetical protein n=1 Tax=Streptomyces sp. NPDC048710 TaxID=3365586 RepID=UPI00371F2CEA